MIEGHGYSLVISTTDSELEADALAEALVRRRLAACVQLSRIVSHYLWQGKPTRSDEVLLLIKTTSAQVPDIIDYVGANHSYDIPELIEVPITSGSSPYLEWIDRAVTSQSDVPEGT